MAALQCSAHTAGNNSTMDETAAAARLQSLQRGRLARRASERVAPPGFKMEPDGLHIEPTLSAPTSSGTAASVRHSSVRVAPIDEAADAARAAAAARLQSLQRGRLARRTGERVAPAAPTSSGTAASVRRGSVRVAPIDEAADAARAAAAARLQSLQRGRLTRRTGERVAPPAPTSSGMAASVRHSSVRVAPPGFKMEADGLHMELATTGDAGTDSQAHHPRQPTEHAEAHHHDHPEEAHYAAGVGADAVRRDHVRREAAERERVRSHSIAAPAAARSHHHDTAFRETASTPAATAAASPAPAAPAVRRHTIAAATPIAADASAAADDMMSRLRATQMRMRDARPERLEGEHGHSDLLGELSTQGSVPRKNSLQPGSLREAPLMVEETAPPPKAAAKKATTSPVRRETRPAVESRVSPKKVAALRPVTYRYLPLPPVTALA